MAYAAYTLLKVAIEQRELLNFGPATLIYHAARLCAESSSEKVGETAELERDIVEKIDSIETALVGADDAEALLRAAQKLEAPSAEGEPIHNQAAMAIAVASLVGEADCNRLLGKPGLSSALLARLLPSESATATAAAAEPPAGDFGSSRETGSSRAPDSEQRGPSRTSRPSADDESFLSVKKMGEAPAVLQAFWLELLGGSGGGEYGRGRLEVLLALARQLRDAPRAPDAAWRVMASSCEQRPRADEPPPDADEPPTPARRRRNSLSLDDGGSFAVGALPTSPGASSSASPHHRRVLSEAAAAAPPPPPPPRWPADGVISVQGVQSAVNPESLLDAAIRCMWGRRPADAAACLARLIELMPFWRCPHCEKLPAAPAADRLYTVGARRGDGSHPPMRARTCLL